MTVVTMQKINKKIPGILPPPPKNEIDGKIANLSSKSVSELLEIKERQFKLLSNKYFISKLPDKGAKIQAFHDRVAHELEIKQDEEKTCRLFDKLSIRSAIVDKNTVQNMEWEGKMQNQKETYLDSDDDSEPEDVMQILSQNISHDKKIKVLRPEKPLITPEDVVSIGDIPHVKYIVEKTESTKQKRSGLYKPFKTTVSDVHNPEKEILRRKHKNWENTAATPPPIVHGPTKMLNLEESLKLQKEYNQHLKDVEGQHAAERLLARTGIKMVALPDDTSKFGSYRELHSDADSNESDPEGSDKEVHDEEPERGGVVFTVMK